MKTENWESVLDALGEKIRESNNELYFKTAQVADLKKRVEELERENNEIKNQWHSAVNSKIETR